MRSRRSRSRSPELEALAVLGRHVGLRPGEPRVEGRVDRRDARDLLDEMVDALDGVVLERADASVDLHRKITLSTASITTTSSIMPGRYRICQAFS
jgi:hypothetical protein